MPQIETQLFLDIVERANQLAFWDLETSGLGADYQSTVLATIKPYNRDCITLIADRHNKDKKLVRQIKELLEQYTVLCAHNCKRFDIPYLNTRLLKWRMPSLESRHHIDTYQILKPKLRTSSKSQAALLSFLELPQQKMSLPPSIWQEAMTNKKALKQLIDRCESDCIGLEQLYKRTRHLIKDIKCV